MRLYHFLQSLTPLQGLIPLRQPLTMRPYNFLVFPLWDRTTPLQALEPIIRPYHSYRVLILIHAAACPPQAVPNNLFRSGEVLQRPDTCLIATVGLSGTAEYARSIKKTKNTWSVLVTWQWSVNKMITNEVLTAVGQIDESRRRKQCAFLTCMHFLSSHSEHALTVAGHVVINSHAAWAVARFAY